MNNVVHCCDCMELMKTKPDKFYNFIFIDPPYFKIKGEFDFKMNFNEWVKMHSVLAQQCYRILKNNGSIILWGHAKNIAYQQIEFDKYFNLLNSCVWIKKNCRTKKNKDEDMRRFKPITERFLFYDKGGDKSGLTMIYSNPDLFKPIKKYMREEKEKIKKDFQFKTEKEFNDFINAATDTKSVVSRHYFADSQYIFPTQKIYNKLQQIKSPQKEYKYFQKEYEELRKEYEELRRPFFLRNKLKYDAIEWDQESNITKDRDHPTQKPPGLVKQIILSCCNINSKIFEPFVGTETVRKICYDLGFWFEGCEIDRDYWQAQEERFKNHIANRSLPGLEPEEIQEHIFSQGKIDYD